MEKRREGARSPQLGRDGSMAGQSAPLWQLAGRKAQVNILRKRASFVDGRPVCRSNVLYCIVLLLYSTVQVIDLVRYVFFGPCLAWFNATQLQR